MLIYSQSVVVHTPAQYNTTYHFTSRASHPASQPFILLLTRSRSHLPAHATTLPQHLGSYRTWPTHAYAHHTHLACFLRGMEFDRSKWPIFTCEALFEPPTIGGSSSPGSSDKLSSTHSMVSFPMMMNPEVRTDRFVVGTWAAACVACVNRTRQLANQRAAVCSHRRESSCLRWVSASARCSCLPPSRCSNRPPRCRSRTSRFVRGRECEGERETRVLMSLCA